jgi:hypothetical protein
VPNPEVEDAITQTTRVTEKLPFSSGCGLLPRGFVEPALELSDDFLRTGCARDSGTGGLAEPRAARSSLFGLAGLDLPDFADGLGANDSLPENPEREP